MELTVLSIAYPFSPVGEDAVGGAEQILSDLDRALTEAGRTSLVAGCEGSQTAGQLFASAFPQRGMLQEEDKRWCRAQLQAAIDRALRAHRVDLVHMHGLDFFEYDLPVEIPALVTLHMPVAWYGTERLLAVRNRVQFVCVSQSQRRSCPAELGDLPVIENGVELPGWAPERQKGDYALVLSRICPEKNIHEALEAGGRARTRVLLGGWVFPYPEHQRYFHEKVEPLLGTAAGANGAVRHEFLGPVHAARRAALLSEAKCLLHSTVAPETSSLVAMEAMAVGTPVIAYRSGALPEIVEDGVTGFLVDGPGQMAEAISQVHRLEPAACRRAAEKRFSRKRMVARYFELYRALVERRERACA